MILNRFLISECLTLLLSVRPLGEHAAGINIFVKLRNPAIFPRLAAAGNHVIRFASISHPTHIFLHFAVKRKSGEKAKAKQATRGTVT